MFSESTVAALCEVVNSDKTASGLEKIRLSEAILRSMSGSREHEDRVVSFSDASRILGFRNPQTARNMAKSGKLKSVYGTGTKRPIGVSMSSVQNVIANSCKN